MTLPRRRKSVLFHRSQQRHTVARVVTACVLALVLTTCLTAATRVASVETAGLVVLVLTAWIRADATRSARAAGPLAAG